MEAQQNSSNFTPEMLLEKVALLEAVVREKDALISSQSRTLSERERVIKERERVIKEHGKVITEKEGLITEKQTSIDKLTADLAYEKFQNEQLRRMIYGAKRERFIPKDIPEQLKFEFEPGTVEIEETVAKEREAIRVAYLQKKDRKPHPGRVPLPSSLPVIETIIEPEEDTSSMVCIGREVTDELDYTPAKLHINRTIRPKYITPEDEQGNQKQVIATLNRPIPKCIASAALLAMFFVEKFLYHLPWHRIQKRMTQMGYSVPSSTFESWIKLANSHIRPLFMVHRLYVFREQYQQIDESPIKVQDRDKPNALHQGYMWVRNAPLPKAVLFEYYKGRSSKKPLDDLAGFKGYIQTDGYAGYTHVAEQAGITHLSCWAHARRYFIKALGNDKQRAAAVLKLIQLLYAIEALAREQNMSHAQRHALRLEKSLPIINEIGSYIYNERNKVLPQSPIGRAFEYCANRWISLQNYLKDGMLEIDSNFVENAIRPLAIGRKNYLFAGSHEAAEDMAMIYSFIGTCVKNEIDPQKWLAYVINNVNNTPAAQMKDLLPQYINRALLA
jgi:transposase